MNQKLIRGLVLVGIALLCTNCVRNTDEITVPEAETEAAVASDLLNNIGRAYELADQVLRAGNLADTNDIDTLDCAIIRKKVDGLDSLLIIDYNTLNFCSDNKTRVGRIYVYWRNAGWRGPGRFARIETRSNTTADEYKINGDLFTYSITIRTNPFGAGANPSDTLRGMLQVLAGATGANSSITIDPLVRNWTGGANTPGNTSSWIFEYTTPADSLAGSATGLPYKAKIRPTVLLRRRSSCAGFTRGILEIKPPTKSLRTLDYGADVCDNIAVLTVDGKQSIVNF